MRKLRKHRLLFLLLLPFVFCAEGSEVRFIRPNMPVFSAAGEQLSGLPWLPLVDTSAAKEDETPTADGEPRFAAGLSKSAFELRVQGPVGKDTRIDLELVRNTVGHNGEPVIRLCLFPLQNTLRVVQSRSLRETGADVRYLKFQTRIRDGKFDSALYLPFSYIVSLTGRFPFSANRPERWEVRVMLFDGAKFYGIPPSIVPVCESAVLQEANLERLRSELYSNAVSAFFAKEPKTGGGMGHNILKGPITQGWMLKHFCSYYNNQKLWRVNWKIEPFISFPIAQSWLYFFNSRSWNDPLKDLQSLYMKESQTGAERIAASLLGPVVFAECYSRFTRLPREWERLRLEGIRHHMFSEDYMKKE